MSNNKKPSLQDFYNEAIKQTNPYIQDVMNKPSGITDNEFSSVMLLDGLEFLIQNEITDKFGQYGDLNDGTLDITSVCVDLYLAGRYDTMNNLGGDFAYPGKEPQAAILFAYRMAHLSFNELFKENETKITIKELISCFSDDWVTEEEFLFWFELFGVPVEDDGSFLVLKHFSDIMFEAGKFSLYIENGNVDKYDEKIGEKIPNLRPFSNHYFQENFVKALNALRVLN
jgi:hypothetical protein